MNKIYADLHIHSVLSPCADLLMTSLAIIDKLKENNIKIFSITDHNSIKNLKVFKKKSEENNLILIPGIEIQSAEEIHVLAYFENLEDLEIISKKVEETLPAIKNREEIYGYQLILDDDDEFQEKEESFLAGTSSLSIDDIFKLVKENNGIVVPAHIDRTNSILSNLGYIPDLDFDAFEVYMKGNIKKYKEKYNIKKTILSSSDAHVLESLNKAKMYFNIEGELNKKKVIEAIKNNEVYIEGV